MHAPALGDRSLFPELRPRAYCNHAAISPPSLAVRRAVDAVLAAGAREGAQSFRAHLPIRERLRARLGRLVGAAAADVALTPGTSYGLAELALCVDWKPGDRVVLFEGEFPANVTPWQRAAEAFGLGIASVPARGFADGSGLGLERVEDVLRAGARLVAMSAVRFQDGTRMPVEEVGALCRRHGAELCVDAIQALGAVPLGDLALHADYIVGGAHKWLMGLDGCGFVSAGAERAATLRPRFAGWLSHEDPAAFLFRGPGHLRADRPIRRSIDFLEIGGAGTVAQAALDASVGLIEELGVEPIFAHANAWMDRLEAGLLARGFESLRAPDPAARACILALRPPAGHDVVALFAGLDARGVACSIPDGNLRFSPHWPNSEDEVPFVLDAIDEVLEELPRRAEAAG